MSWPRCNSSRSERPLSIVARISSRSFGARMAPRLARLTSGRTSRAPPRPTLGRLASRRTASLVAACMARARASDVSGCIPSSRSLPAENEARPATRSRILSSSRVLTLNGAELVPESLHDAVADLVGLFVSQGLLVRLEGEGVRQAALAVGQGEDIGQHDLHEQIPAGPDNDRARLVGGDAGVESHAELAVGGREAADGPVARLASASCAQGLQIQLGDEHGIRRQIEPPADQRVELAEVAEQLLAGAKLGRPTGVEGGMLGRGEGGLRAAGGQDELDGGAQIGEVGGAGLAEPGGRLPRAGGQEGEDLALLGQVVQALPVDAAHLEELEPLRSVASVE